MLNKDYKDILRSLSKNKVKFLVVGAYAMGAHGYPRATGDIDLWVEVSQENSVKIFAALTAFGAPHDYITERTFCREGIVFQIGVPPRRIDILTSIDGVDFAEAYSRREEVKIGGICVPFISKTDLIKNKEASGREKDKLDSKYLKSKRKRYG